MQFEKTNELAKIEPMALTQRHVASRIDFCQEYSSLSKNRLVYTLILLIVIVILMRFIVGYALLYALLILPVISYVFLIFAARYTEITETVDNTEIHTDHSVKYNIKLCCKSFLPFTPVRLWFYDDTVYYESDICSVRGTDKTGKNLSRLFLSNADTSFSLSFPYRGIYPVGIRKTVIMDHLGLFAKNKKQNGSLVITVYPKIIEGFLLPLGGEFIDRTQNNANRTDSRAEQMDLRFYAEGDDSRKIHWKLSAKKNELVVKDFQARVLTNPIVFIDTKKTGDTETDDLLASFAASAVFYLMQNAIPAELCYGAGPNDVVRVGNAAEFTVVLRLLAILPFDGSDYMPGVIEPFIIAEPRNIIIIVNELSCDMFEVLCGLLRARHKCALISVKLPGEEEKDALEKAGAVIYCNSL